jgi:hypothetical protein
MDDSDGGDEGKDGARMDRMVFRSGLSRRESSARMDRMMARRMSWSGPRDETNGKGCAACAGAALQPRRSEMERCGDGVRAGPATQERCDDLC